MESGYVTVKEIAGVMGKSLRAIQRIAKKEGWESQVLNKRGDRRFLIAGLPGEVQEMLARVRYGIEEDDLKEMVENFEIIVPPEKLNNPQVGMKIRMLCECLAVPEKVRGRNMRIRDIAESYGYNVGTAYRLMSKVKSGKPINKSTKNHGVSFPELGITLRAWDEAAGRMAIEILMANRRNHVEKLSLYKELQEACQKEGLRMGCYRSFLHLHSRIGPEVTTYRDKGLQGLRQDIVPPIQRDPTAYRPMENLVGDQHKADYYAFDSNGDVVTLELFCWLDFRTQLVWGSIAYKHYNRYTVGQALLNAVKWGLPSIVYTDWGKPELSNYMNQLIEQLTGLGIKAKGIRRVKAKVKHPQAKPIEPWFGWLDRNIKNKRVPGYCKRLKDSRENEMQQKELKRQIKAGELLSTQELIEAVFSVIEGWNIHKFKNRREDTGKSPLDIYNAETKTYPVTTLTQDVCDYIFLPRQETVIKRSLVKVKHEWLGVINYYHPELAQYGGEEAVIRYNPFDPSCVWVFVGKALICQAEEWGMINPKKKDDVIARIEKQNHLIKVIREKYKTYLPEKKTRTIPRIGPHVREARQVAEARVMRTPFDGLVDTETGEIFAAQGGGRPVGRQAETSILSKKYSKMNSGTGPEEPKRPLFRLTIDDPARKED